MNVIGSSIINKRPVNQDTFWAATFDLDDSEGAVAVVCDGMGGLSRGEEASQLLVTEIKTYLEEGGSPFSKDDLTRITALVHHRLKGEERSGTTITYVAAHGGTYFTAQLGDSKAFIVKDNDAPLDQLTEEHTQLNKLRAERGEDSITAEDIVKYRSVLTKAVGPGLVSAPTFTQGIYKPGDSFLVCSDGFWKVLSLIPQGYVSLSEDFISKTTQLAIDSGEVDNITAVAILTGDDNGEA